MHWLRWARFDTAAVAILAALSCLPAAVAHEGPLASASACASCHRPEGAGTAIPSIAGWDEKRIVDAMLAYRSGQRASQIMRVVASAVSLDEIAAIARVLAAEGATQKPAVAAK